VVHGVKRMVANPPWRRNENDRGHEDSSSPRSSVASSIWSVVIPLLKRSFSVGEKF